MRLIKLSSSQIIRVIARFVMNWRNKALHGNTHLQRCKQENEAINCPSAQHVMSYFDEKVAAVCLANRRFTTIKFLVAITGHTRRFFAIVSRRGRKYHDGSSNEDLRSRSVASSYLYMRIYNAPLIVWLHFYNWHFMHLVRYINSSNNNSNNSNNIFKEFLQELLPFITDMCNASLTHGCLSVSHRHAIITPRLKKAGGGGDQADVKN